MTFEVKKRGSLYTVFHKGKMLGRIYGSKNHYRALGQSFPSLQDALDGFRQWYKPAPQPKE